MGGRDVAMRDREDGPPPNTRLLAALEEVRILREGRREGDGGRTQDLIREARAGAMYGHPPEDGWVDVRERLPATAGRFLICGRSSPLSRPIHFTAYFDGTEWATVADTIWHRDVTHWRELPALPEVRS
jgi:hypothetical protein